MSTLAIWATAIFWFAGTILVLFVLRKEFKKFKKLKEEKANLIWQKITCIVAAALACFCLVTSLYNAYAAINPDEQVLVGELVSRKKCRFSTADGNRSLSLYFYQTPFVEGEETLEEGKIYRVWYEGRTDIILKIEQIGG